MAVPRFLPEEVTDGSDRGKRGTARPEGWESKASFAGCSVYTCANCGESGHEPGAVGNCNGAGRGHVLRFDADKTWRRWTGRDA